MTIDLMSNNGHASINAHGTQFIMDNARNGFSLYHLDGGASIQEYVTGTPRRTYPKQVDFAEGSQVVVGGSDHGMVYVFDSGKLAKYCRNYIMAKTNSSRPSQYVN